jgi:hypothetical protein
MRAALESGSLMMCEYLHSRRCPWPADAYKIVIKAGRMDLLRWLCKSECPWDAFHVCETAAETGSIDMMRYLIEREAVLNPNIMNMAAALGYTELCSYLQTIECPWGAAAYEGAASGGHTDTLRCLLDMGRDWKSER